MRLNILGTGAIGSAVAGIAAQHGVACRIYSRKPSPAVTVSLFTGEHIELTTPFVKPSKLDNNDVLLLPLKAYQVAPALSQWRPYLSAETPVILMHNGMGGAEIARELLPENPVFLGTTRMGALKQSASKVKITGKGTTDIGFITPQASPPQALQRAVFSLLEQCLEDVVWHQDIYPSLWNKLSINAVINPLTALHDIPNGELLNPRFDSQIQRICEETAAVMQASQVPSDADELKARVLDVAAATATNYSSMHQDVAHQRQTEIDAINGYIVTQAKKKGISVPENALLVKQITELTQR